MRRRLDLAASLVGRPRVLFLDEPTTGLDPHSRNEVWGMIRELVADGTTVLLTTQYLEEADQLAHDIAVIDHGAVIATGTPDELKASAGRQVLEVTPASRADLARGRASCSSAADRHGAGRQPSSPARSASRSRAAGRCRASSARSTTGRIELAEFALRRASLDEVFLALTGHRAEETDTGEAGNGRGTAPAAANLTGAPDDNGHSSRRPPRSRPAAPAEPGDRGGELAHARLAERAQDQDEPGGPLRAAGCSRSCT